VSDPEPLLLSPAPDVETRIAGLRLTLQTALKNHVVGATVDNVEKQLRECVELMERRCAERDARLRAVRECKPAHTPRSPPSGARHKASTTTTTPLRLASLRTCT
jgi:hypothetical protein